MAWWKTIDIDTSWQDLDVASEIALAYDRRVSILTTTERTAAGVSWLFPSGDPSESNTVYDLVYALQVGIAKLYAYFSDPTAALAGSTSYPANYASAAAMFTAAGLTSSGYFRRIASGGTQPATWTSYGAPGWSYGTIQSGDLAGPWLWIDMQNALTALTRRIYSLTSANAPNLQVYDLIGFQKSAYNTYPTWTSALLNPLSNQSWQYMSTFGISKVSYYALPDTYEHQLSGTGITCYQGRINGLPSRSKSVQILGRCTITDNGGNLNWAPPVDLGTGWTLASGTGIINIMATTSGTTATSIDFWNPPQVPSWNNRWTTLINSVPWPVATPGGPNQWANNKLGLRVEIQRAAVDFDFDL